MRVCLYSTQVKVYLVKMAKTRVRARQWTMTSTVAGHTPTVNGVMRDILPDEKYEVLAFYMSVNIHSAPGQVSYFAAGRNVDPIEPATVAETLSPGKAGVFLHYEPEPVGLAAVSGKGNMNYLFQEPIVFDENDSMNFHMRSGDDAEPCTYVITIHYRVYK